MADLRAQASQVHGTIAADAADQDNPVKVGGRAVTTKPAVVGSADRADFITDVYGRQFARLGHQDLASDIFTTHHIPAANTLATASRSAGAAGVRHVCTAITVALAATATAPTAVQLNVQLIDGASGGGTYLWRAVIALPAVAGAMTGFVVTGLWLPGTAATAMTLEFSAAGGANTVESASFSSVDVAE